MKKALSLILLILSLDKEEFDDFIALMQMLQNKDERVIQALANIHRELNEIEW